jgi:hypothetical protein
MTTPFVDLTVKFTPNDRGTPPGKLADAELHFTDSPEREAIIRSLRDQQTAPLIRGALDAALKAMSALAGLKLIGFGIWERRTAAGRNVTFPARQYSINGERRSFALLRPIVDIEAQARLRDQILEAFAAYEQEVQR